MIKKIRQFIFKQKYKNTYEKEAWAYALEAGLVKTEIRELMDALKDNIKSVDLSEKKQNKLKEELTKLKGEAYAETRAEIDTLGREISSIKERNEDLQKKLLPTKNRELAMKLQSAQNSLIKAQKLIKVNL